MTATTDPEVRRRARRDRAALRRARGAPGRVASSSTPTSIPADDRRADEGAGAVRHHDPRGVRRARARPAHLHRRWSRSSPYGWMSLSGIVNTHTIAAQPDHAARHRRAAAALAAAPRDRRAARLPLALGARRRAATPATSRAGPTRDGDEYVITGTKMWVTNGERAGLVALAARTDEGITLLHRREGARARRSAASP